MNSQELKYGRLESLRTLNTNADQQNQRFAQFKSFLRWGRNKLPPKITKYIQNQAKLKKGYTPGEGGILYQKPVNKMSQYEKVQVRLPQYECQLCGMEVCEKKVIRISNKCDHKFCPSCLRTYVIYKLMVFQKITCPKQNCTCLMSQRTMCYKQLPINMKQRYQKYKKYFKNNQIDRFKLCPNQACSGQLGDEIIGTSTPSLQGIKTGIQKCSKCKRDFCRCCMQESHEEVCENQLFNKLIFELNYSKCPYCQQTVKKSSGNHISCSQCGYQFCYVCQSKWGQFHPCDNRQNQITCLCCNRDNACCYRWDQFWQKSYNCIDTCLQKCCFSCCSSLCKCCQCFCVFFQKKKSKLDNCCSTLTSIPKKIFNLLLIIVLMIPALLVLVILYFLAKILVGILVGLLGFPFLIRDLKFDMQWYHIILGTILLPFTLLFMVFLGLKLTLGKQGWKQLKDLLIYPFKIIKSTVKRS